MQESDAQDNTSTGTVRKRKTPRSSSPARTTSASKRQTGDQNRKGTAADDHSQTATHFDFNFDKVEQPVEPATECSQMESGTFWLTRIVLLRYLGFIYLVAFLVAYNQNKQLIGPNGLLPANLFLRDVKERTGGKVTSQTVSYVPSVLWLFDYQHNLAALLDRVALMGMGLAGFVMVYGAANWFIMLTLWSLYHSLVNVGQTWYGFGWESQLLETGFLATFLCPVWSLRRLPKNTPTSYIVILGFRWLIFRIMLGAGLIKIRGDQCWRDLTCMNYHYETQPVPNPMSYYMHQSPEIWHKFETLSNHFVELIVPFLLFMPRPFCMAGGAIQIFFQVVLIISGNLSFLNWLTILPSLACYDDASLVWLFPWSTSRYVTDLLATKRTGAVPRPHLGSYVRRLFNISLGVLIMYLSLPVINNLLSSRQAMNTSFDPLRLVNTYGAFGSVTKTRKEVIFQGTSSLDPNSPSAVWEEYEFKCKPGNVNRTPCLISPYHYRLDWLMWFAGFQTYQHNPWLLHLAVKLLVNDKDATSLIEQNPFEGRDPPKFIRAEHYRYRFTKIGSKEAKEGAWWRRKYVGNYMPPVSLESVRPIVQQMGWKMPKIRQT
ncbi:lipase maturation factor 1-like [Littorina saxatilis]|uniref:Lipase maturation factor n=1 Tax=Littorina saxatilis TaxID=31220 RepID=A0AAN9BUJ5_9CAEN